MTISDRIREFQESLWDTLLAAGSILVDVVFWVLWALITSKASNFVESLEIETTIEKLPYIAAQWSGCGVLLIFVVIKTLQDIISMVVGFCEFWNKKKLELENINSGRRT